MMIGEGLHNYVSSNGKLIDANGVSDDLDELLGKRDMGIEEDQDTTVEECGLFYKPYDKEDELLTT